MGVPQRSRGVALQVVEDGMDAAAVRLSVRAAAATDCMEACFLPTPSHVNGSMGQSSGTVTIGPPSHADETVQEVRECVEQVMGLPRGAVQVPVAMALNTANLARHLWLQQGYHASQYCS